MRRIASPATGPLLEDDGEAPPLSSGEPLWAWNGKPLTALFDKIHKEMPHNKPGTLSPHDAVALNQVRYESKKPGSKKYTRFS